MGKNRLMHKGDLPSDQNWGVGSGKQLSNWTTFDPLSFALVLVFESCYRLGRRAAGKIRSEDSNAYQSQRKLGGGPWRGRQMFRWAT